MQLHPVARRTLSAFTASLAALVVVAVLAPVAASAAGGTPTVVLDPDNGFAHSVRGGVSYESFPINLSIAQGVRALLPSVCAANITLTQTTGTLTNAQRAAQMTSADVSVTLSMNALDDGTPWGFDPSQGGSSSYATTRADNLAFGNELVQDVSANTGRPFKAVNTAPTNGTRYPYPEYSGLSGTYAQLFMLFIDNNFDFPVWHDHPELLVNSVTTGIAKTLQAKGFKCLGKFPALPSATTLQQLRNLGYQQFLAYGAEPVSMSTGNFSTAERTFQLSGVGNQVIDLTLNYNAQSGQDSPVGVGWEFAYGAFLQQYSDGSVLVSLADGRVLLYAPDGGGGFTSPAGAFASLTQVDATTLRWTTTTGTSLTFTQDGSGRGMLTSTRDRQGNTEALVYSGPGALFPKLATITDQAGQQVAIGTNSDGRITSFTRPDGAVWQLGYSASGDLTSITSARGTIRSFGYDTQHRMTSEVGQDGVTFLTNAYDANSRVVDQTNAFGQHRHIAYDDINRRTTYTDTTGAVTVYRWNALGEVTQVDDALGGHSTTTFNSDLLPTTSTDPLSHTTTKTYDGSGQVTSVTDPVGSVASRTYNGSGDLTSTTDAGGSGGTTRTYSYSLNGSGLPTTVTNPDGSTQTRTYNAAGDITSSTNEAGATTTYSYDSRGNTTKVTDPLGRVTNMTYDVANRLTSVTDPLGHTTAYAYDANDNLTKISYPNGSSEQRTYDVNDQLASSTDRRGGVTTYSHDAELNLIAETLPNGGTIHHTFDSEDRLTSTTDPLGNVTTYTLDALGRIVSTTDARGSVSSTSYNAAGQVISQTDAGGATTSFTLDADGRVLKATDPAGGVTTTTWDAVGRRTSMADQLGHKTTYAYNFRDSVASTADPAGGVTANEYDAVGRLVKRTDAAGAVTTFTYDAAGQLVKQTDALGGVTSYSYDAAGNRTSVTDADGHVTGMTYDAMNQLVSLKDGNGNTTAYQRDGGGLVLTETDPLGHKTTYSYDSVGNVVSTTDALSRTTKLGYDLDSRQTSQADPDGVVTQNQFDPVGNLTGVIRNARGGEPASATVNVTNTYVYDARNLLTSSTDPNGAVTKYQYDARRLLTGTTDPLGAVTAFTYDAAGNRTGRTDANGVATSYGYDPRDLLVQRTYPDASKDVFGYDAVGRQTSATNATGAVNTTYDPLGRVTQVTDANGQTLKYGYDAVGNRTGLTLPDGRTLTYTYDAANNLTKLVSPLGTMTTTYDAANRPTSVARSNGTTTTVGFDNGDELTQLVTKAGSATLASFTYSYDAAGNVASRTQTLDGTTTKTTYTYDPLRRLTADAGGPLPSSYTYDAAGNRLTWTAFDDPLTPKPNDSFVQTNAFNAAGELTSSTMVRQNGGTTKTDVTSYTYDNDGNRTLINTAAQSPGQSAGTAYTYDFENRLTASGPAGDRSQRGNGDGQRDYSRTYDALGRLVTETRGTTATKWTEDGLNPIIAADSKATLYLRDGSGQLEGEQTTGSDPSWYVTDALGSILGVTTTKAKLTGPTTYSDYGVNLGGNTSRLGFGGEIADPIKPGNGIGNDTPLLDHYYARSYDPGTGTWLQRDPNGGKLSKPQTLPSYQFAGDSPSSNRDLLGFLSVGVANPGTISLVGVAHPGTISSVGVWNGGPVQQSTIAAAQILQPTISAQQLQPAVTPFRSYRSPAAYGAGAISRPLVGSDLQGGTNTVTGQISVPRATPTPLDLRKAYASGGLVRGIAYTSSSTPDVGGPRVTAGDIGFLGLVGVAVCLIVEPCGVAVGSGIVALGGGGALVAISGAGTVATEDAALLEESTGRTAAESLSEQLAMQSVEADPTAGKVLTNIVMNDPRWPASDGWVKMEQVVNNVVVHYVYNVLTGESTDFKFK